MLKNAKVRVKIPENDEWVDLFVWSVEGSKENIDSKNGNWSDYQEVKIKEAKFKYEGLLPKGCLVQKKVNLTSKFTVVRK